MAHPRYDVEQATSGLVIALFLAMAVLLAVIAYHFLGDLRARTAADAEGRVARDVGSRGISTVTHPAPLAAPFPAPRPA